MTDSVFVLPPGERVTDDATGAPISGATLYFYDAGTANPKTVYADAALTASLGTSVVTDSLGYPTSDGTTRTLIYVGTSPYKLVIKDAAGNTIATHDNIPGAVVSASSVDISVTATFPLVTKSLDYAVVAADQNKTFLINCSSGDVALTLPSATDNAIPNGWGIKVQHEGSANQAIIKVASGSGQSIFEGSKTYGGGQFALALNGEDCTITADGGDWRVSGHTVPFIKVAQGIIPIVSRVSTSPGSPDAGAFYLLTGTGGSFSSFASGDIAQYTGAGWVNFRPYTDCGWTVYVADEDRNYQYLNSAWVASHLSTPATQTTMEAATAGTPVTADMQQFHPGHPKVWGSASVSGGVPTLNASYNMTSITDAGTGLLTATIATDFSSAAWSALCSVLQSATQLTCNINAFSAGTAQLISQNAGSGTATDPSQWSWAGLGDQ